MKKLALNIKRIFCLILAILLVFNICIPSVNAIVKTSDEINNNYIYTIEGHGYILCSNYFKAEDDLNQAWNALSFNKKVDISEYNNLLDIIESEKKDKILIEISEYENIDKINEISNNIEIVELNNVKYAVADVKYVDGNYCFAKAEIDNNVLNSGLNFMNKYFNDKEFSICVNVYLITEGINSIDWINDIDINQTRNTTTYIYDEESDTSKEVIVDYCSEISLNTYLEDYKTTLTPSKFLEEQKYLKDNNIDKLIQTVKVYIPNNVVSVKDTSNNEQYAIHEVNGNKYIEYDIEIMKSNLNDVYDIINYYEEEIVRIPDTYLEFKTATNEIKTCCVSGRINDPVSLYSNVSEYGSSIGDKYNNHNIDKFKVQDEHYGECYAVSSYYRILRAGGWDEDNYPAQTNINYLNEYIYFEIPYNVGNNLTLHAKGIEEMDISFDFWKKNEWHDNHYIYRTKITQDIENILFSKPQNIELSYTTYNEELRLPHTIKTYLSVEGKNRTKLSINGDDINIDFNGVLPTNVSIKSDKIEKNTDIYTTLTTTGISNLKSKYGIYAPIIHLSVRNIYTVGGNIDGAIQLTFNIGQEYNGEYIYITHLKHNNEWEHFKEKVKDGKVSIVVNELSPFMLSMEDSSNVIKGDLDRNGVVNSNDAAVALDIYNGRQLLDGDLEIGDMNNDGVINSNDAAMIMDVYNSVK